MRRLPILALPLAFAACQDPIPELQPQPASAGLPEAVCSKVKDAVDALQSRGVIVLAGTEATIDQAAWSALDGRARDNLVQTLGFNQACAQPGPTDRVVTIRNENGQTVIEQVVSTSANIGAIIGN